MRRMKQIGFGIILVSLLMACIRDFIHEISVSSREVPPARSEPLSIDKAQIDLAASDPSGIPPSTNWFCYLRVKTDYDQDHLRLLHMIGKTVQITDHGQVLGNGKISSVLG